MSGAEVMAMLKGLAKASVNGAWNQLSEPQSVSTDGARTAFDLTTLT